MSVKQVEKLKFINVTNCNTLLQKVCRVSRNPAENRARNFLEPQIRTKRDEILLFL